MSNSSDVSPLCSPDIRSDDIVFSTRPSPVLAGIDNPQSPRSPQRYLRSSTRSSPRSTSTTNADETLVSGPAKSISARSQPIAIELPAPRKVNSAPVYTPPAPLSARGDLPGGYFPLHEEQNRLYRPHPFQLDATKARLKSIQRASKDSPANIQTSGRAVIEGDIGPATPNLLPAQVDRTMEMPQLSLKSLKQADSTSTSTTPVASYMPLGDRSSPLPMGKYYPSNYERRKDEKKAKKHRPTTSAPTMSGSTKSESQVPTVNQSSSIGHSRNESDAKARLQQYQRDMIAQASIALGRGNPNEATLGSIRQYGFNHLIKPNKPRLVPLGSPGPVTPMELEGSETGYLEVHGGVRVEAELSPAESPEEVPLRHEGSASPSLEFGRSTL
ncbi:hypothetical protein FHL15_000527 [Xylaria flabelliformis]|uniref:Uncharacterized protein n=1 Tax=Xylaria flabelliformis TaxID=2512241 RepID=A0A553IE39_9PEZI|nr:hypothetical protein FHL15_000527 [Xylaria flabelliformis]